MENKILLLEDDLSLVEGLKYSLRKNGFDVDDVRCIDGALKMLPEIEQYDLLILDITLPDGTGFEICEKVRSFNTRIPVIFLTAADEETNIIRGLDCGGDDYIRKPFKVGELCSRICALLRRAGLQKQNNPNIIESGDISIDLLGSSVKLQGKILDLTNVEYRLLCLLVKNANRTMTREAIIDSLWNRTGDFLDNNTLSVYIRRLREKIEFLSDCGISEQTSVYTFAFVNEYCNTLAVFMFFSGIFLSFIGTFIFYLSCALGNGYPLLFIFNLAAFSSFSSIGCTHSHETLA